MKRLLFAGVIGLSIAISAPALADMHEPEPGPKMQLILGGLAWHIGQDRDKRHHKGSGWQDWSESEGWKHKRHKRPDFDEELFQPAIGIAYGAWEAIAYENSFDDISLFLGYNHQWPIAGNDQGLSVYCGLRAGVATGYDKANSDLVAVLHPNVTVYGARLGLELGVLPTGLLDPMDKRSDAVFTTALRFKF